MNDTELLATQQKTIEKLTRKVKRLEKRLLEKKKYETETLIQLGSTPQYIDKIDAKDRAALETE